MGQHGLMKLDIQKFASISKNGSRNHHKFTLDVNETYVSGGGENYSNVSWSLKISPVQTGWDWNYTNAVGWKVTINGTVHSGFVSKYDGKSTVTWGSGTDRVYHNSDGTKSIEFIMEIWDEKSASYLPGYCWQNGTMALTTIPRFANITSFSVSKRDETSVTYNWSADASCDYAWYSLDGSNWSDLPVNNVVGGLQAGQTYGFYLKVRRTDSQLTTDTVSWGPQYQQTYYYPHVTSCTSATIGQNISVYIYNPLGRTYTLQLISTNNNQIIGAYTGSSTTDVTGFADTGSQNAMYASIPNSTQGQYRTRLTYGSWVHEWDSRGYGNYYVDTSACKPTFNLFTWEDINVTTLALTGDSSTVVKGQSNIEVTIDTSNKAIAKNSASIIKYIFECGSQSEEITYSSSQDVTGTINAVSNNTFKVRAVDSRGIPSDYVTLVAQDYILYENLRKGDASIERTGGVSQETSITFDGWVSLVDFGEEENTITNITYQYKTSSDADYTTGLTPITPTIDENGHFTFTGQIRGDTNTGFDIQNVYSVLINVFDKINNPYITYELTLGSGKPHVAYYKDGVAIMGKYDEQAGGALQVKGDLDVDGEITVQGSSSLIYVGVKGDKGDPGPTGPAGPSGAANSLSIGTVTKGSEANATITGTAPTQLLNLVLPKGDKGDKGDTGSAGPVNSLSIGTVTTGATSSATITGTSPNQVLNLVLEKGEKGDKGDKGDTGPKGDQGIAGPAGEDGVGVVVYYNDSNDVKLAKFRSVLDNNNQIIKPIYLVSTSLDFYLGTGIFNLYSFENTTNDIRFSFFQINELNIPYRAVLYTISGDNITSTNVNLSMYENYLFSIGDVANLTTTAKNTTVAAINEVNSKAPVIVNASDSDATIMEKINMCVDANGNIIRPMFLYRDEPITEASISASVPLFYSLNIVEGSGNYKTYVFSTFERYTIGGYLFARYTIDDGELFKSYEIFSLNTIFANIANQLESLDERVTALEGN